MLAKGCGHLARASDLNLRQFAARGGASRGRVSIIPPFDHQAGGVPPFDHFPLSKLAVDDKVFEEVTTPKRGRNLAKIMAQ